MAVVENALKAYLAVKKEVEDIRAEKHLKKRQDDGERLRTLLRSALGATDSEYSLRYDDSEETVYAILNELPKLHFSLCDEDAALMVSREVQEPPNEPPFEEWWENPANDSLYRHRVIRLPEDLGEYLVELDSLPEPVVQPWSRFEALARMARTSLQEDARYREVMVDELNKQIRPFEVVCVAQVVAETPHYLILYLD